MASHIPGNPGTQRVGPSEGLEAILGNQSEDIRGKLRGTLDTFLQYYSKNAEKETVALACKCCTEAQTWYWRMLESHVRAERKRLGRDVSGLLRNDLFHCCLAACSLDIAIVSTSFPCDVLLLLQMIRLPPYHFLKVIEPLLRSDVDLPTRVSQRLHQVEIQIVERLAWASDSPLWDDVKANKGGLPSCKQVMTSSQLEEPNTVLGDHSYCWFPKRTTLRMFARKKGSNNIIMEEGEIGTEDTMQMPHQMVYGLVERRLRQECRQQQISEEIRQKIWTCFDHSLVHFAELMLDRHLDQLMLCAIKIMTKVCKIVLNSGEDAENQSHGSHILTPNTPSSHHPAKESICDLEFYNRVYVTKMEPFVKQFQPLAGVETPPLSPYPPQPAFLKQGLSSRIYVSPLTQSPIFSYTVQTSTSECLKDMNKMLRHHTQTEEESGDEPVVKSPRLENESLHQKQVQQVFNDRMKAKDQA